MTGAGKIAKICTLFFKANYLDNFKESEIFQNLNQLCFKINSSNMFGMVQIHLE